MRHRIIGLLTLVAALTIASASAASAAPPQSPAMTLPANSSWSSDQCSDWYGGEDARREFDCYWEDGMGFFVQEFYYWDPTLEQSTLYKYLWGNWVDLYFYSCYVPGACEA